MPQRNDAEERGDVVIIFRHIKFAGGINGGARGGQVARIQVREGECVIVVTVNPIAFDFSADLDAFFCAFNCVIVAVFINENIC